jgi:hypothetical protein
MPIKSIGGSKVMTDKLKEVSQFCEKSELIAEINRLKAAIEKLLNNSSMVKIDGVSGHSYIVSANYLEQLMKDVKW